jgi:hypothetical protein
LHTRAVPRQAPTQEAKRQLGAFRATSKTVIPTLKSAAHEWGHEIPPGALVTRPEPTTMIATLPSEKNVPESVT